MNCSICDTKIKQNPTVLTIIVDNAIFRICSHCFGHKYPKHEYATKDERICAVRDDLMLSEKENIVPILDRSAE